MSPAKRVALALRRAGAVRDEANAQVQALLAATRRDVMRQLTDAAGYRRFHLSEVLAGIDAQIQSYKSQVQGPVGRAVMDAARAGQDMAAASGTPGVYGVSHDLLRAVVDVTNDQVRAVWSELGTGLKVQVRRATLGVTDPFEAIQKLVTVFAKTKQWRETEYHAERIIRTEVGRAFQMAGQEELERAKESGLEPKKWWLAIDDARARETHLHAWRRYQPGGDDGPIPADEHFEVGDVRMLFPGDPDARGDDKAVAGEVINCRCSSVPYVEGGLSEAEYREIVGLLREAA